MPSAHHLHCVKVLLIIRYLSSKPIANDDEIYLEFVLTNFPVPEHSVSLISLNWENNSEKNLRGLTVVSTWLSEMIMIIYFLAVPP